MIELRFLPGGIGHQSHRWNALQAGGSWAYCLVHVRGGRDLNSANSSSGPSKGLNKGKGKGKPQWRTGSYADGDRYGDDDDEDSCIHDSYQDEEFGGP